MVRIVCVLKVWVRVKLLLENVFGLNFLKIFFSRCENNRGLDFSVGREKGK
jgi:hypothetical protein